MNMTDSLTHLKIKNKKEKKEKKSSTFFLTEQVEEKQYLNEIR